LVSWVQADYHGDTYNRAMASGSTIAQGHPGSGMRSIASSKASTYSTKASADRGRLKNLFTAATLEPCQLRLGFHPFRHHGNAQVVGHEHDGLHELGIALILNDVADEGAIDFKRADGETLEIGERGIPGTEIIDGDR